MKLAVASWEPLASKESGEGGGVVKGKRSSDWQSNPRWLGFFRRGKWGKVEKKEKMIPPTVNHSGVPHANEAALAGGVKQQIEVMDRAHRKMICIFFLQLCFDKKKT